MTSDEDRLTRLCGRLSHDAWLMICGVRDHPRLAELLDYLENLDGPLSSIDLEIALRRFVRLTNGKEAL